MSDKGDYESESSLSSAQTDVKVIKKNTIRKNSDNYADNIETRDFSDRKIPLSEQNIKLRRKYRSWIRSDTIPQFKKRTPPHSKSDGENDTPNTESDSVKKRRSKAPAVRSERIDDNNKLRNESVYMDYYNGRKYKAVNGWKIPLEIKCREIGTECAIFRWLHNKNAVMLGAKLTSSNLAIAIVGAVSTVSVLVDYIANNYYKGVVWIDPVMKLITFLLTLSVTIISIVQRTYDFMQKIEFHRNAERRHTWLFYDIQSQLQKNPKDRTSGDDYFKWITHELNSIADSNDIDDDVIKEFYKTFQDTKIPGLDTMNELQVYMEDDSDSISKNSKRLNDQITPIHSIIDLSNPGAINTLNAQNTPNTRSSPNSRNLSNTSNASNTENPPNINTALTENTGIENTSIPLTSNYNMSTNSLNTSVDHVGDLEKGIKKSGFAGRRSSGDNIVITPKKRINDNYVRAFREQRDMNMINLTTNTNMPNFYPDEQHRLHNPEMMNYEMNRMKSVEEQ